MSYYIFNISIITVEVIKFYKENPRIAKEQYYELMEEAQKRGLNKSKLNGYYEEHHIIPRCLGGQNIISNLVLLEYKEHILAHLLLYSMCPDNKDLFLSFSLLVQLSSNHVTSEELYIDLNAWDDIKRFRSEFMKGNNNPMKNPEIAQKVSETRKKLKIIPWISGKHHSEKTKQILREKSLALNFKGENHPMFGKHHTEEARKKMSENLKGEKHPLFGKHLSESTKNKLSKAHNNPIMGPDGTVYDSVKDAAKKLKIHRGTLFRYLRENPEKGWKRLGKDYYKNLDNK